MHFIITKIVNQNQSSKRKYEKMHEQCYLYFTKSRTTLLFINEISNTIVDSWTKIYISNELFNFVCATND